MASLDRDILRLDPTGSKRAQMKQREREEEAEKENNGGSVDKNELKMLAIKELGKLQGNSVQAMKDIGLALSPIRPQRGRK